MLKRYSSYKKSVFSGLVPSNWQSWKLRHAYRIIGSGTTPEAGNPQYYENGTTSWLNTGDLNNSILRSCSKRVTDKALNDFSALKVYPKRSLAIAMYGATIGKVSLLEFETTVNQACCVFSDSDVLANDFMFYWFVAHTTHLVNLSKGGGQPNISKDILCNLRIFCPSLLEQTQIARYLDQKTSQIVRLITDKEKLIGLLNEERTAIINQAVTKGLNPDVPMKDSGVEWLGEVPEHWAVKKLKYVSNLKSGDTITSEVITQEDDYPVYGGNGLRGYFNEYNLHGDYVLIGRQGALCGNINYASNKFWASEHAIVCHLVPGCHWRWFGSLLTFMNLNQYSQSAAQPGLSVEKIKNLLIPVPSSEEQTQISEYISREDYRIEKIIETSRQEIQLLKEYKTALISEVVTGKVDVRDEIIAESTELLS